MILCSHQVDAKSPLFVIAGPCVIESEAHSLGVAQTLADIAERLGILVIFKSSFDKANRTSGASFRGPGLDDGLRILEKVRSETGLPVLTDVHEPAQAAPVAEVVDVLQTPAFLARQTDFICSVAATGKPVNIKKAQFMAPADMQNVVAKARSAAEAAGHEADNFMLCERGTSFGYNTLVSDMRGLSIMAETGCPIVFDATHSVQQPGGLGSKSGGQSEYVPLLARAAVAAGVSGVFMETHPDPANALSDGPNALPLDRFEGLVRQLQQIDEITKIALAEQSDRSDAAAA
ncbi:3-deoxy-8-phosphooctulonate synthase [Erythrobacter sp. KY5]|uniref:3-deoxy-8-phosphooctulonate synthase n=1 Tax=Erythrobacter sp. KY5 TaxID=2011159 RepID=UPI000DBEF30E|nr:3-deoxy-8-phosphooctulonate synthase [Erythrobacter sp. KY5]AWW73672.1 3-deoxy-8-phosphooctulonate synthase [Erythrobacter sp. KY5]